jgi:hypothetical protein
MEITTDEGGINIELTKDDWMHLQYFPNGVEDSLRKWSAILRIQTQQFLRLKVKQTFTLIRPRNAPLDDPQSPHIALASSSGIEDDLFGLTCSIYGELGSRDYLSYSYVSPKGGPHKQWLDVLIDCGKDAGKALAGIVAKAIFDYFKKRVTKPDGPVREIVLYGPDSHVYKSFTIVGEGEDAYIKDEREDYKFPPSDALS